MLTYKHEAECLDYIFERLSAIIDSPRLQRPPYGGVLKELLEFLQGDCQVSQDEGLVGFHAHKWEEFNLRMVRCTVLLISVLLDQRGIKTIFGSVPPGNIYDGVRSFRPIVDDLQNFIEAGKWFEDEQVADVLQVRLEIVFRAALLIMGNLKRGDSEEAREQTQDLFEGMLRQLFVLLIRPSIVELLE